MPSPRLPSCLTLLLSLFALNSASAQENAEHFGVYKVHYSVFNSTFLEPEIAQAYNLVRARDQVLVNISINKTQNGSATLGLPAAINGSASNLMQQQQTLEFKEISEGDATYYIAPLKHTNEETYNFTISVDPEGEAGPFELTLSRTLYVEIPSDNH